MYSVTFVNKLLIHYIYTEGRRKVRFEVLMASSIEDDSLVEYCAV
jgi:predicted MarR family transcription regulator